MSAVNVNALYPIFTDIDGQPLEDGYVWIGVSGLEPQANPQTAYWDAALTQVATQPVRTRGGYPLNGAAIGRLFTGAPYSIKVQNKRTSTIATDLSASAGAGVGSISFGTTGLTPAVPTDGDVVVAGTLAVANGGTGVTTATGTGSVVRATSPTVTGPTVSSGNLAFSGTAQRITGDMSNATTANRLMFQNSVTNGGSQVNVIPNGTSQTALFRAMNNSDATNASAILLYVDGTRTAIISNNIGTGAALPLAFETGGSERVRVDTSGNVGIGTASPGTRLTVAAAVEAGARFLGNGLTSAGLFVGYNSAAYVYNDSNTPMIFGTNATERMRIDASGNVGIGTASPTFRLVSANSVTDGGWMYSSGAVSVLGLGGYANAGDGAFQIRFDRATGSTTLNGGSRDTPAARVTIDNTGNVGIGTSSPADSASYTGKVLDVAGPGYFRQNGDATKYVSIGTSAGITYLQANGTGNQLAIFTGGSERLRIDSSGNVGIGTASPGAKLDVVSSGGANIVQSRSTSGYASFLANASTGNQAYHFFQVNSVETARITSDSGNVLAFSTGNVGTERMRIDSSGNINIATAGARITADFSNATVTNRVAFQTSTANSTTSVAILPSGTATDSNITVAAASDAANAALGQLRVSSTAVTLAATRTGTGSFLPLVLQVSGGANALTINTGGNVVQGTAALGTTATDGFLWITSCAGAPTGAPTAPYTNAAALICDTTNNRLYVRVAGTWRYTALI